MADPTRVVKIPVKALEILADPAVTVGISLHCPVLVDWPELRLTEEQQAANLAVRMRNILRDEWEPEPYTNHQLFIVELPIPVWAARLRMKGDADVPHL